MEPGEKNAMTERETVILTDSEQLKTAAPGKSPPPNGKGGVGATSHCPCAVSRSRFFLLCGEKGIGLGWLGWVVCVRSYVVCVSPSERDAAWDDSGDALGCC